MNHGKQAPLNDGNDLPIEMQSYGHGHGPGFTRPVMQQPEVPAVVVLQEFEAPADSHCFLSWMSCLLCPVALPFGLAALICSSCAYCDTDRKSRRWKSKWARTCSIIAFVFGAMILAIVVTLLILFPSLKVALLRYFQFKLDSHKP